MKSEARAALDKAYSTLKAANLLLREGMTDNAASEAYYAMFHAATAALADLEQSYSRHSAVIAAFGREFAKTGALPVELHRDLREGFLMRQRATYDYRTEVPHDEALAMVHQAADFVAAIATYLQQGIDE